MANGKPMQENGSHGVRVRRWNTAQASIRDRDADNVGAFETEFFYVVPRGYLQYPGERDNDIYEDIFLGGSGRGGRTAAFYDASVCGDSEDTSDDNDDDIVYIDDDINDINDIDDVDDDIDDIDYDDEPEYADEVFVDDDAFKKRLRGKRIVKEILRDVVTLVAILMLAILLVSSYHIYVRRTNQVFGSSMEPTLYEGETVYTSLLPYVFGEPQVGDIVVIDYTRLGDKVTYLHMLGEVLMNSAIGNFLRNSDGLSEDTFWIKRVVAVAGDTVEFHNGQFYRNGEPVEEEYIKDDDVINYPEHMDAMVVPEGYVYLMGDNRNVSRDSRNIGCVSIDVIIGKYTGKEAAQ